MKKRKVAQIVVILAILLIPAFYAFMFLYAYWNPVGYMSNVPVAVVNCDQGGTVNGESVNIGKDLMDSLKSNDRVKWVFTDKKDAYDGVLCQKYYAELVIPDNFTKNISSAGYKTKTQGILYFKSNDKLGMMASSLLSNVSSSIETNISRSISQSIVDNLTNKLQGLPASMQKLSDGLAKMDDGSKQLLQGMLTLSQGQTAFNAGLNKLATGLDSANQGGATLENTLQMLSGKSELFVKGINGSVTSSQTLSNYSRKFKDGLSTLTDNLDKYLDYSSKQLQSSINMVTFLKKYIAEHPETTKDANIQAIVRTLSSSNSGQTKDVNPSEVSAKLSDALNNLNSIYAKINSGIQQIPGGMQKAAKGEETLSDALRRVSSGSLSLLTGLNSANGGANLLNEKSKSILAGEKKISTGLTKLNSAVELMKSSLDSSISQMTGGGSAMQGLGKFIAQPVKIESTKIGEAKNSGTALTPFMVSLCLYIGGFMIMVTIFSMDNLKFNETNLTRKIHIDLGLFRYQLIGVAQALLIAVVVHLMLGLNVQSAAQFYGICILGSLAFTTLVQVLVMLFQSFGKLLCLLFMICQITAGGGVIPSEILPPFYRSIYPYMPMTYTINALRNVILSIESKSYNNCIAVLIGIAIVSALFVMLLSFAAHRKNNSQTQPITA
ncbi:MAG TPA: YhgE/Pip domain-containing protein [Clostridia bacterium]|nr:YhgE/Pip domain-containing protein [Clostridia bacterium]